MNQTLRQLPDWRNQTYKALRWLRKPLGASMLKVKVVKSARGRGQGCAQNIAFENGGAFVTGAYSEIDWDTKEYLIARLARVWNMTCDLPDDVIDALEAHLTQPAPDK